jgi:hypothetical protein
MARKEIKITLEDVKQLMGSEFSFFEEVTGGNVFCINCYAEKGTVGMNILQISLSPLNDIVAVGTCMVCGKQFARYLETGENPDFNNRANKFRRKK